MDNHLFRQYAHELVDWMADYLKHIEELPVRARVVPGEIKAQIPTEPHEQGVGFDVIFKDFQSQILKGATHWQHPSFHAYFPANNSYPSVLAEMLTATMGLQCMVWESSPAATELEEQMMEWLKCLKGLPAHFQGVIQDGASTATLCALLSAREKKAAYQINERGFLGDENYRIYCSVHTHNSLDKAVKIAGLGEKNIVRIAVDEKFALIPAALAVAIERDLANGNTPLFVVAAIGSTSSTAIDPLEPIGEICQRFGIWLHVDAAYAGTAAILPEMRWILKGITYADSYVFNPHKWLFTNLDCSAYFVKDKQALIRTFQSIPEYLKTKNDSQVTNYRDWGIQLGRRFRALKLWFVLRSFGAEGIRAKIREHLRLAKLFETKLLACPQAEILAPTVLNLVCFRMLPYSWASLATINAFNETLLARCNDSGKAYLTHTKLDNKYTIRAVFGQTNVAERHINQLFDLLMAQFGELPKN